MYSKSMPQKSMLERLQEIKCAVLIYPIRCFISQMKAHGDTFVCGGDTYVYMRFHKNTAYTTERVMEIPIVSRYTRAHAGHSILEVGNVLNHYVPFAHEVVDKYECGKDVHNVDIIDFYPSKQYDLVVCISTLEHIGFDEEDRSNSKTLCALERMQQLTSPGGQLVITIPLGWNPYLDEYIKTGRVQADELHLMHRVSCENTWEEVSTDLLQTKEFTYNTPYPYGNWILILIFQK